MIFCDRCGIEVPRKGLCEDCIDVTTDSRRPGHKYTEARRKEVYAGIRELAAMNIPERDIATHYGIHKSTVRYALGKVKPRQRKKVAA